MWIGKCGGGLGGNSWTSFSTNYAIAFSPPAPTHELPVVQLKEGVVRHRGLGS